MWNNESFIYSNQSVFQEIDQFNKTLDEVVLLSDFIDRIVSKINLCSMAFGIVGNLFCIIVLFNKHMLQKRFHYYLLALAFSDLFYCLIVFSNYAYFIINPPNLLYDLAWSTCYLTDFAYKSFDSIGVILTLIVSFDRVYAIRNPLALRNFFTYRFPKRIILFASKFIYIFIQIINENSLSNFDDSCQKLIESIHKIFDSINLLAFKTYFLVKNNSRFIS